ncbi:unnamed protein product, partial [Vitis vinifera]|uniref:Uncharacterized protein n=1 Tax=Vitis vinifera TaxID=29760 RepID=E0CW08_VITVI
MSGFSWFGTWEEMNHISFHRFHAWKMLGLLPVAFLVSECPRSTFLMRVMDKLAV